MDRSLVLPDSRMAEPIGSQRMVMPKFGAVNQVPIYCANCGEKSGWVVPEEHCTFACYLCDPCAAKWGALYGTLLMPDEVFWRKVAEAELDKYGRILTDEELKFVTENTERGLSLLLNDAPNSYHRRS